MVKLNLPDFEYNLKEESGKVWIFDSIRKKFVVLTPEEWVRQHFLNYLIEKMLYPKALIKIESGLLYNRLQRRSDIVVYNRQGTPWMLIECKSPSQSLNEFTVRQVSVYNTVLKAKYISVTNGITHLCYEIDHQQNQTQFLNSFPNYPSLSSL